VIVVMKYTDDNAHLCSCLCSSFPFLADCLCFVRCVVL
jgi:hypothetical protein